MKKNRKMLAITAGLTICLLAVGAMSRTGRATVTRVLVALSIIEPVEPSAPTAMATASTLAQSAGDVEQRARTRHGWNASIVNTLTQGTIEYYDESGTLRRQLPVTIYRKFPNKLRVEIGEGSGLEIIGFEGSNSWRAGAGQITDEEARDIRAFLRVSPERLFLTRRGGAGYREAGRRSEDRLPATPWRAGEDRVEDAEYDQVEMEDLLGPAAVQRGAADRRRIYYYVDRTESLVSAVSWLEPIDPQSDADSRDTDRLAVRVDFGNWQTIAGVVWPMEIVHWLGGKVDYRILASEVKTNQQMADSLFERPVR